MFIINRIMFQSKLFLFFILLCILRGSYEAPYQNRKLLKYYYPDYDNRYVWFTRDIHDDGNNQEEIFYRKHLKKF